MGLAAKSEEIVTDAMIDEWIRTRIKGEDQSAAWNEYSKFNTFLFGVQVARTDGTPHQMVSNTEEGNGFEAWRSLNKEYNPLTGNSARAYMQAILAYTSVAKLELVSAKIAEVEEVCKHYAEHAGKDIDADVKVGKLFDILPKDTKDRLLTEERASEVTYAELKQRIVQID